MRHEIYTLISLGCDETFLNDLRWWARANGQPSMDGGDGEFGAGWGDIGHGSRDGTDRVRRGDGPFYPRQDLDRRADADNSAAIFIVFALIGGNTLYFFRRRGLGALRL